MTIWDLGYTIYSILDIFVYVIIFILGLALGSFLNSWIWRNHENVRISKGRSICPNCRRQLKWYENVPVVSFLLLGGNCRTCKHIIPKHFVWVELITALIFVFVTYYHVELAPYFEINVFYRDILFIGILVVIFIYDYLYKEIPSSVVWLGMITAVFFNWFTLGISLLSLTIGSVIAGGFFLFQYLISKGRWIGGGDVRMGFMIGLMLGWPNIIYALLVAYIVGAIFSVGLLILNKHKYNFSSEIPFGTFLVLGTLCALFHADQVINWYINLIK